MTTSRQLPDVYENLLDNQLGILPPGRDNVFAKFGHSSSGPVGEVVSVSDPSGLEMFGTGPLVESAAYHLSVSGAPLLLVRLPNTTPGTVTPVAETKTGTGTLTVAGEPNDAYAVSVNITRAGEPGTAAFTYSLDGGDNVSREMAVQASGTYELADTGLTLTFAGPFEVGDAFTFSTTVPTTSVADIMDAMDVLLDDPREWSVLHIGAVADAALAAAVETKMQEAATNMHVFARAVLQVRDYDPDVDTVDDPDQYTTPRALKRAQMAAWSSNILKEFENVNVVRTGLVAGFTELASPYGGQILRRPLSWAYVARLASIPVHEHVGYVARGAVTGVLDVTHNELAAPGLDAAGFVTSRTFHGRRGYYLTRGKNYVQGSDYTPMEHARVMDKACRTIRNAALNFINNTIRIGPDGKIDPVEAELIEAHLTAVAQADMLAAGNVSDIQVKLDRDGNLLSTRAQRIYVSIRPLGYLEYIFVDFGFFNPALQPIAQ